MSTPAESQSNSHSFFWVVLFMVVVVLGTIITYFVFLPKSAPKQIHLAVLPFGGPADAPESLTIGFPADIRNELSLSRDVKVIDFHSSLEVFDADREFLGLTEELGASHFVDGTILELNTDGSATVQVRLVNITHSAWKNVWTLDVEVQSDEWEQLRQTVVKTIRENLYDLNTPRSFTLTNEPQRYKLFLSALAAFHMGESGGALDMLRSIPEGLASPSAERLYDHIRNSQAGYLLNPTEMYEPSPVRAELVEINNRLKDTNDLAAFKLGLERLAADFPNSIAVSELADLYLYAGWLREAKQLLYHWALLRPRSLEVGVRLAHIDFINNDIPGAKRALDIAGKRSERFEEASCWLSVLENRLSGSDEIVSCSRYPIGASQDCDSQLAEALYRADISKAEDRLSCARRSWVNPPVFWKRDDPLWLRFTASATYRNYLEQTGYARSTLEDEQPMSTDVLFAPRRGNLVKIDSNAEASQDME